MVVTCPYGLGDSATVLPKLAQLAREKRFDSLTYYLTGYYPHLLYRFFINFDFGVPTKYVLSPWAGDDVVDTAILNAHPQEIDKLDILDVVVSERYWERHEYLAHLKNPTVGSLMSSFINELNRAGIDGFDMYANRIWRKFRSDQRASDIVLSRFSAERKKIAYAHCVAFQPVTTLRSPRNFVAEHLTELFRKVVDAFAGSSIYLVGTYDDYLSIKELVDSNIGDGIINTMGRWDVAQVVQLIFDADVVIGCNSWVSYLGALCDRRSAMYIPGGLHLEPEFSNRIVSKNFYGTDSIALGRNLDTDAMLNFLTEDDTRACGPMS